MDKWNEEEYLASPFHMNYETIVQLCAPEPEEVYHGGEDVFFINLEEMDFVDEGVATGVYMWNGNRYLVGVATENNIAGVKHVGFIWLEDKAVWLCKYEQDDDDKPLGVLFIAGGL